MIGRPAARRGMFNHGPTLVRLTENGIRGCNKRGGDEFESKRIPVRDVLASAETTSSVPPDYLTYNRPEGR